MADFLEEDVILQFTLLAEDRGIPSMLNFDKNPRGYLAKSKAQGLFTQFEFFAEKSPLNPI